MEMKCYVCKQEIDEIDPKMIHIGDGDFVCNEKCEIEFEKKRSNFFNHIGNDEWYQSWLKGEVD
jgi:hypothetical protein